MSDLFESEPQSPLFPARTIAALLECSEREISNLVAAGVIQREARGLYSLVATVQGYMRHLRARARPVEDLLFTQQETAALLGISVQAFVNWRVPSRQKRGREVLYYWPDVLAERDKRQSPRANGEGYDARFEQAREHRARADKLELENAAQRGELIYAAHMTELLGRAYTAFRARLRAASSKLAPRVNPENPNLARDIIDREHDEALAELADFDPGAELAERGPDVPGDRVGSAAAAAADGEPVGRRRKKT